MSPLRARSYLFPTFIPSTDRVPSRWLDLFKYLLKKCQFYHQMSSERILQMSFSRFFIGLQFLKSHIQIYTKLFRYRYSLQPCGLEPTRLLHPWDSPGKNTGVGCHFLLQGIFPTQGLNPGLPHCRQML